MIENSVQLTLAMPTNPETDEEKVQLEEILVEQTHMLVEFWRRTLSIYKEQGLTVPTLAFKNPFKKKEERTPLQATTKELLDYCIQFAPNVNPAEQRVAIIKMLEFGWSKEDLIERFDQSRERYPMTTWRTVLYWAGKDTTVKKEFERNDLDPEAKKALIERVAHYKK